MINFNKLENAPKITVKYNFDEIDGNYIRLFRKNNNLTQCALANIFNVSIKTIQRWESGKQKVTGPATTLFTLFNSDKNLLSTIREVTYPIKQLDKDFVEVENLSDNVYTTGIKECDITMLEQYVIPRREQHMLKAVVIPKYKDRFVVCRRNIDKIDGVFDRKQRIFIPFDANERTRKEAKAHKNLGIKTWLEILQWEVYCTI